MRNPPAGNGGGWGVWPLAGPVPLFVADWMAAAVRPVLDGWRGGSSEQAVIKGARRAAEATASSLGINLGPASTGLPAPSWPEQGGSLASLLDAEAHAAERAASLLEGRLLLEAELYRLLEPEGFSIPTVERALDALVEAGRCLRWPAVGLGPGRRLRCHRCGEEQLIWLEPCARCGSQACPRCGRCAGLGLARGCDALLARPGSADAGRVPQAEEAEALTHPNAGGPPDVDGASPARNAGHPPGGSSAHLQLPFPLARAQAEASDRLRAWVRSWMEHPRQCLVWAACGAGKTEVAFGAIEEVLRQGEGRRAMFAVPRREVALEVAERARRVFQGVEVAEMHGEAPKAPAGTARLVVATTHQALRFYQAFDLVVLDEADAFPLRGSAMLYQAVERARKPAGGLVVMTATPQERWLQQARAGLAALVTIPARHHGHPLPEPTFVIDRQLATWRRRAGARGGQEGRAGPGPNGPAAPLPRKAAEVLARAATAGSRRLLVFVPAVALAEPVAASLRRLLGRPVEACHSGDPARRAKVEAFRRRPGAVLVSTTVMERGVTVEALDVAVLFADEQRVFDAAALVQMAGRVGRTAADPAGEVWFIGASLTAAMAQARDRIRELNREAARRGLLRDSLPHAI